LVQRCPADFATQTANRVFALTLTVEGVFKSVKTGEVGLVVDHSGGKDSMRMLGKLREEYPDIPKYCVTADTGFEHQKPISASEWVKIRCATLANAVAVTVVRNEKKTYLRMVEERGMFPSGAISAVHF